MTTHAAETAVKDPLATARDLAREFAREAAERDTERRFPYAEMAMLRSSGLAALRVPKEYGGLGADVRTLCAVLSALGEGDPNIAQMFYIHTYGVALANFGDMDENGRAEINRRLVEGTLITNAFSEIGTKNVFSHSMKMTPAEGGDYLLDGKKFYCTGSLAGDMMYVLGVTPDGKKKVGFVETSAPGVTINDDWSGMGQRTTASGSMAFEKVRIRKDLLVNTGPFDVPTSIHGSLGQLMFSAIWVGVARAALQDTIWFVREKARPWGDSGIDQAVDDPYKVHDVAEGHLELACAEGVLARAIDLRDRLSATPITAADEDDRAEIATTAGECNVACGRLAMSIAQRLFKTGGASSAVEKYAFDRHWRNVRTMSLHDPADWKLKWSGDWHLARVHPPVNSHF